MSETLSLSLPEPLVDALAEAVLERIRPALDARSPKWMTRAAAADYLGVVVSRLEKDRTVPCHYWGSKPMYHVDELDEFIRAEGSR